MKRLILVRHATAAPKGPNIDDFTRSLRKKGRKESQVMVNWYKEAWEKPDLLLSSPANRAIETARIFAKGLGIRPKKIAQDDALYGGLDPDEFLALLKTLDDKHDTVMVFGHDPDFSEFAKHLVEGFGETIPKCGIVACELNRKVWRTIRAGDGRLVLFGHPEGLRLLRQQAKKIRRELTVRMEQGIKDVLAQFGIEDAPDDDKKIQKASAGIAKTFANRVPVETVQTVIAKDLPQDTGKESAT